VGHAMVSLCTKYEVSRFSRYEAVPQSNFAEIFGIRKLESLGYRFVLFM